MSDRSRQCYCVLVYGQSHLPVTPYRRKGRRIVKGVRVTTTKPMTVTDVNQNILAVINGYTALQPETCAALLGFLRGHRPNKPGKKTFKLGQPTKHFKPNGDTITLEVTRDAYLLWLDDQLIEDPSLPRLHRYRRGLMSIESFQKMMEALTIFDLIEGGI